jgi:hypothetical protein
MQNAKCKMQMAKRKRAKWNVWLCILNFAFQINDGDLDRNVRLQLP